ncbi:MAG: response regulator [Acidobacteria bacterium]|nr:response regulator [Acidobacteriota bacterium]
MILESAGTGQASEEGADYSHRATILLVEDEERVREVIELTLSFCGYKVLSTESAIKALEIIENYDDTIDLMVTDFAMPHMNGAELAAKLKRARPRTRVLYVSGFQKQEVLDVHEPIGRTTLEFLQKPFMPEELEMTVQNILAADD